MYSKIGLGLLIAKLRYISLLCATFFLTSCGFIIESITDLSPPSEGILPGLLNVPINPVYLTASDSYLKAQGACLGYQVIEFTYSSSLTPTNTIVGKCANDSILINLPVHHGDKSQIFSVKIIGYLTAPTSTLPLPPNVTVNYDPPTQMNAGFGITSGGKPKLLGTFVSILGSTVAETTTGTQSSGSAMSRSGLQGAIDP